MTDPKLYRTIVADPPWKMEWRGGARTRVNGRGERHTNHVGSAKTLPYDTMTVDAICDLDVSSIAEPDAHLYIWIPDSFLIEGVGARVAAAWGFKPGRLIIWRKPGFGLGRFPRPQHESVIVCRRGNLPFRVFNVGSVQTWKLPYVKTRGSSARQHSRKPDGFQDLVERASPGPYLEMFARRQRLGWDTMGNEALSHVTIGDTADA